MVWLRAVTYICKARHKHIPKTSSQGIILLWTLLPRKLLRMLEQWYCPLYLIDFSSENVSNAHIRLTADTSFLVSVIGYNNNLLDLLWLGGISILKKQHMADRGNDLSFGEAVQVNYTLNQTQVY